MTDIKIIMLIVAGCFALWLLRRFRRKRKAEVASAKLADSIAKPEETKPESSDPDEPDSELLTVATFSPAYHDGVVFDAEVPPGKWPVIAIEDFPAFDEFDPARGELTEFVSATYAGPDDKTITLSEVITDAADVVFAEICGMDKKVRLGLTGPAFNKATDFSTWPEQPYRAKFSIQRSVLERARKDLPDGFDPMPVCMTVKIHLALFGR